MEGRKSRTERELFITQEYVEALEREREEWRERVARAERGACSRGWVGSAIYTIEAGSTIYTKQK